LVDAGGPAVIERCGYLHGRRPPWRRWQQRYNRRSPAQARHKRTVNMAVNPVTLSQLRTFAAVARHGSLTAAARALGVSVPAVSAAIAALRKEFGDELVIRSEGGTALTPGGLRLAAAAAEMVAIAEQARRAVLEAREGSSVLRIAATHEIGEYAIGPLVESFRI